MHCCHLSVRYKCPMFVSFSLKSNNAYVLNVQPHVYISNKEFPKKSPSLMTVLYSDKQAFHFALVWGGGYDFERKVYVSGIAILTAPERRCVFGLSPAVAGVWRLECDNDYHSEAGKNGCLWGGGSMVSSVGVEFCLLVTPTHTCTHIHIYTCTDIHKLTCCLYYKYNNLLCYPDLWQIGRASCRERV